MAHSGTRNSGNPYFSRILNPDPFFPSFLKYSNVKSRIPLIFREKIFRSICLSFQSFSVNSRTPEIVKPIIRPGSYDRRKFRVRSSLVIGFFFTIVTTGYSQLNDIGMGAGAFNATGDLTRKYEISNVRPAINIFFRTSISEAIAFRYGITAGLLSGKSRIAGDSLTGHTSFHIGLVEASGVFEYTFLDYKSKSARVHWSPFLYAGGGIFVPIGDINKSAKYSLVQPVLPLGFGIKYQLNPKFDIGVEASSRITFFDYLDKVSDVDKSYRYGNKFNNDVYYYIGLTLYYTFYIIPCPYDYD